MELSVAPSLELYAAKSYAFLGVIRRHEVCPPRSYTSLRVMQSLESSVVPSLELWFAKSYAVLGVKS